MNRKGFTLIEAVVVVAIVAVLMLAARSVVARGPIEARQDLAAIQRYIALGVQKAKELGVPVQMTVSSGADSRVTYVMFASGIDINKDYVKTATPASRMGFSGSGQVVYYISPKGYVTPQDGRSCAGLYVNAGAQTLWIDPVSLEVRSGSSSSISCSTILARLSTTGPSVPNQLNQDFTNPSEPPPPAPPSQSPPPPPPPSNSTNPKGTLMVYVTTNNQQGTPGGISVSADIFKDFSGGTKVAEVSFGPGQAYNQVSLDGETYYRVVGRTVKVPYTDSSGKSGYCTYVATQPQPTLVSAGKMSVATINYNLLQTELRSLSVDRQNLPEEGGSVTLSWEAWGAFSAKLGLNPDDTWLNPPANLSIDNGPGSYTLQIGRNPDPWQRPYSASLTLASCPGGGSGAFNQVSFTQEAGSGTLSLNVSGLPSGARTKVSLAGTWKDKACPTSDLNVANGQSTHTVPAGCDYTLSPSPYEDQASSPGPRPKKWVADQTSVSLQSGSSASARIAYRQHHAVLNLTVKGTPALSGKTVNVALGSLNLGNVTLSNRDQTYTYVIHPGDVGRFSASLSGPAKGIQSYAAVFTPDKIDAVAEGSTINATLEFVNNSGRINLTVNHWFTGANAANVDGGFYANVYQSGNCSRYDGQLTGVPFDAWAGTTQTNLVIDVPPGSYVVTVSGYWEGNYLWSCSTVSVGPKQPAALTINLADDRGLLKIYIDHFGASVDGGAFGTGTYYLLLAPGTHQVYAAAKLDTNRDGYWIAFDYSPTPNTIDWWPRDLIYQVNVPLRRMASAVVDYAFYKQYCREWYRGNCVEWYWKKEAD